MINIKNIFVRRRRKKNYLSREQITSQLVYSKVKKAMDEDELFLNPDLDLATLADAIGTNRTYLANALKNNGTSFIPYVCSYRTAHLLSVLYEEGMEYEDADIVARNSGFHSRRLMDKALRDSVGKTFYEIKKRRHKKKNKPKK